MSDYPAFPKIARWSREIIVTEKIDGTNGLVAVRSAESGLTESYTLGAIAAHADHPAHGPCFIYAGSRSRWVSVEADNHGFARWVVAHANELVMLGTGLHYGEWWGAGIQRGYGLTKGEKRFSLFNVGRWTREHTLASTGMELCPPCCDVVPILGRGVYNTDDPIGVAMAELAAFGSRAAPGFSKPEGVIAYHVAAGTYFKKTFDKDAEWKGKSNAE